MWALVFEFATFTAVGFVSGFAAAVWADEWGSTGEQRILDLTRERNMWRAVWKDSPRPPCEKCGYQRGTPREEERTREGRTFTAPGTSFVGNNPSEVLLPAEEVRDLEALPRFADSPHWMWQDFLRRRNESV